MRKLLVLLLVSFFSLSFFGTAQAAGEKEKVYTLRFASLYMDRHPTAVDTFIPWMKEVEAKSNGRLVIKYGNPGAFVPEKDVFNAAKTGAIDIATGNISLVPGMFPRLTVMDLPALVNSGEAGSKTAMALLEEFPEILAKEMKGLKVLWIWSSAPMVLNSKKPIMTLEDIKKEKTNVWQLGGANIIKALGGNPIQTSPADAYLAASRGVVTSLLNAIAPLVSFKISESLTYTSEFGLFNASMICVMSQDSWDNLPKDLQAILEESIQDMPMKAGKSLDSTTKIYKEDLVKSGQKFYNITPEEQVRWKKALEPLNDAWLQDMKKRNVENAQDILDKAKELGAKYSSELPQ